MVRDSKILESTDTLPSLIGDEKTTRLVAEILAGRISDIRPEFDFTSEIGFSYPLLEKTLKVKVQEAISMLDSLTSQGILIKEFFDRFLPCPRLMLFFSCFGFFYRKLIKLILARAVILTGDSDGSRALPPIAIPTATSTTPNVDPSHNHTILLCLMSD
jgi:hypothetical protein